MSFSQIIWRSYFHQTLFIGLILTPILTETPSRSTHNLPVRVLRFPGSEEVVGAVLQATLARHHCHLPEGPGGGPPWEAEGDGQAHQEDRDQILPPGLHSLHQKIVLQAEEEIPQHVRVSQDWYCPV